MEAIVAKVVEVLANPAVISVFLVVLEFVFRLIKTPAPLSIAHVVAKALAKIAEGVKALADFLDKVLPQQVVPPQA